MYLPRLFLIATLLSPQLLAARDLQVDPQQGDDQGDGIARPTRTIARAIMLAQPGDTIHLTPGHYDESAAFGTKKGLPQQPIILNGHGAVLDGSTPILPETWEPVGKDIYRKTDLIPNLPDSSIQRWFFLWNGRMNHMGRSSKGPRVPLKTVGALQPGEWTYVKEENAFYLRLHAGESLATADIRYPILSNGVATLGDAAHLVVKNLTVQYMANDGFNLHGHSRDCYFENITAQYCGDDGFSAHGTCQATVDGFVSLGNSTGITDVDASITHYRRVYIKDCLGHDLLFMGEGHHTLNEVVVESSAAQTLSIGGAEGKLCTVEMQNAYLLRKGTPNQIRVGAQGKFTLTKSTTSGLNWWISAGHADVRECLISGEPPPSITFVRQGTWSGDHNRYHLDYWRIENQTFRAANFTSMAPLIPTESSSLWQDPAAASDGETEPNKRGAGSLDDLKKRLPSLPEGSAP